MLSGLVVSRALASTPYACLTLDDRAAGWLASRPAVDSAAQPPVS